MQKELIYGHISHANKIDCATISAQALIHHPIAQKSIEALFDNTFNLHTVAKVVAEEFKSHKLEIFIVENAEQISPSKFFKTVVHTLVHGKHMGLFIGGVMAVKPPNQEVNHMVVITSLHERGKKKKVTIIDAGPKKHGTHIVRKVPLEWLDRNISRQNLDGPTVIAILAEPHNKQQKNCQDVRNILIEQKFAREGRIFAYNADSGSKKRTKRMKRMKYA